MTKYNASRKKKAAQGKINQISKDHTSAQQSSQMEASNHNGHDSSKEISPPPQTAIQPIQINPNVSTAVQINPYPEAVVINNFISPTRGKTV